MKYIYKVTIFMVLGLLLVSCSKSSTKANSKNNKEIIVRGVLEKGKATDARCEIKTLDGKAYSKSNHIDSSSKGGYVASVPAGAFDVRCTISKYIDDKTGETKTPKPSIVLEAISFAKAGKSKTVNVNVLTDLVAKKLMHSKNKITSESSFNTVRENAERAALRDIKAEVKQDIGDIDTLSLQDKGVLAKVSLAIQEQIDKPNSKITTVSGALAEAEKLHSIANQDVSKLNPEAIATPLSKTKTSPKPIEIGGTTEKVATITLTGATIGREDVATSPTNIDASNSVLFSIPTKNLGEIASSDSVYITSNKAGETTPIKLEGGKNASYSTNDVKDLFKPNGETTFTICVVPTMAKLDSTVNKKCLSAKIKKTFKATAISSTDTKNPDTTGTGIDRAKAPETKTPAGGASEKQTPAGGTNTGTGTGTGYKDQGTDGTSTETTDQSTGTVTGTGGTNTGVGADKGVTGNSRLDLSDFTINGQSIATDGSVISVADALTIELKLPEANIHLKDEERILLKGKQSSGTGLKNENDFYHIDIKSYFKGGGQETNFKICIVTVYIGELDTMDCTSDVSKTNGVLTFTAKITGVATTTIASLQGATIGDKTIATDGSVTTGVTGAIIEFKIPVDDVIGVTSAQKVWIISKDKNKPKELTLDEDGDFYHADVKGLLTAAPEVTSFTICIFPNPFPKGYLVANCAATNLISGDSQQFQAQGILEDATTTITSLTGAKIGGKLVATDGTDTTGITGNTIEFQLPKDNVKGLTSAQKVVIVGENGNPHFKKLTLDGDFYQVDDVKDLIDPHYGTSLSVCIVPITLISQLTDHSAVCASRGVVGVHHFNAKLQ